MRRLAMLAALAALSAARPARAASPESVPVSPEAAIAAAAVVASDDPGGGGWYNPASLAAVKRNSIQVGASAYSESATVIQDAAVASVPWGQASGDIRSIRYSSVPSVLSYTFKVREGLGFSIGVWTPYHDYEGGSTTITSTGPYPSTPPLTGVFTSTYAFTERRDDTWGGVAVGWQATQKLRLGAMLQGSYSTDVWTVDVTTALRTDSTDPLQSGGHVVYSERGDRSVIGVRGLLGLQYQALPELRLAAAVRGPTVRVATWGPFDKFLSTAALLPGVPPSESQITLREKPESGIVLMEPVRVYGAARWAEEGWAISAEGDWHPALDGQFGAFKEGWGGRAGATWNVNVDLRIGAGLFYDSRSAEGSAQMSAMKYAGFTAGAMYRPAAVVKVLNGGTDWDLITCVAVRGAYGWGTYRGISVNVFDPASLAVPAFDGGAITFPNTPSRVLEGSISFLTAIVF